MAGDGFEVIDNHNISFLLILLYTLHSSTLDLISLLSLCYVNIASMAWSPEAFATLTVNPIFSGSSATLE